jgi:hypothetical protein
MDMKTLEWTHMQPLKDQRIVVPVLEYVAFGDLTLQEMCYKFKQLKYLGIA